MTDPPSTPLSARLRDLLFRIIELADHDGPDRARIQLVAHEALEAVEAAHAETTRLKEALKTVANRLVDVAGNGSANVDDALDAAQKAIADRT